METQIVKQMPILIPLNGVRIHNVTTGGTYVFVPSGQQVRLEMPGGNGIVLCSGEDAQILWRNLLLLAK